VQSPRAHLLCLLLTTASVSTQAASLTVNTATDDFGSVTSNCSLREAIESANNNADFGGCNSTGIYGAAVTDVINLPSLAPGTGFVLSRNGTDDTNASGDLDIDGSVRIDGVSAQNSLIRGDTGDPDSDRHRLVHVLSGSVVLNDLTLRDGLEDNQSAGGGLRTEPGSVAVLNRVVVADNIADGNAGGILNRGAMTINGSTIRDNESRDPSIGGGGIFNSPNAVLTINDSQVIDNLVEGSQNIAEGGGIYSDTDAALRLDNSVVSGNTARDGAGFGIAVTSGGGISAHGPTTIIQSSITSNAARGLAASGGGIYLRDVSAALIDRSVIAFNQAIDPGLLDGIADGGGLAYLGASASPLVEIRDSVVSSNTAQAAESSLGGGLFGQLRVLRSTISGNQALGRDVGHGRTTRGGGLFLARNSAVINSTILGNQSDEEGGGIGYESAASTVLRLHSVTLAGNAADTIGGGIRIGEGSVRASAIVVAGNTAADGGTECSGTLISDNFNLIQTLAGCTFIPQADDIVDQVSELAPSANNGGPTAGASLGVISGMTTRAPLPTSPLIDAGPATGCRDDGGAVLVTDQVGRSRAIDGPDPGTSPRCDIGAIEFSSSIFADGFESPP
jgi:CSLREA domain-containing protein